jgi:hypothetical protein
MINQTPWISHAYRLHDRVSLKGTIGDGCVDDRCGAETMPSNENVNAKLLMGDPKNCWHGSCFVLRLFQDEGLLLENRYGFVRHAEADDVWRRYT